VSRRNADRLLHVVGDLLLVSTIEAGKLELDRTRVSLEQLATDAVEAASPRADERGVALALDCDAVPDVRADPARVGQVLDNLVSNAVKFTPPGGRVDVRVARNGSGLLLSVADTGTGIPVAEQPHVFERFFRAKAATRAATPGTGLGLAIASGVVEAHGWKIKLESEEGAGTTVAVAVPQGDQLA
jgi:signal transduction histidine kinase